MTKTLAMVFRDSTGKEVTISLADPKDDLTLAQVRTVMEDIVSRSIFATKVGNLVEVQEARILSRDTTTLA